MKSKPYWYQFSRTVQLCPHCSGAVKLGGYALWFLVLVIPSFLPFLGVLFTGYDFLEKYGLESFGWLALLAGFAGVYMFCSLEKVEET